jgi:hypothetical protein
MFDLIWNFFQEGEISQATFKNTLQDEKLKGHRNEIDKADTQLQDLEKRHEQLKLVTLALWTLLRDHTGLTDGDLRKYIEKVDLLDGQRDGKAQVKQERMLCQACERVILNTARICPYCGTYTRTKPFDSI